jgi:hypothetical protein
LDVLPDLWQESERIIEPYLFTRSTFERASGALSLATWGIEKSFSDEKEGEKMFGKLVIFAIAFAVILNYLIIPVLIALARIIGRLGAEGPIKHLFVVATFALLVFTLAVFVWLTAKFLKSR